MYQFVITYLNLPGDRRGQPHGSESIFATSSNVNTICSPQMLCMLRPCRLTAATFRHSTSSQALTRFATNRHTRPYKAIPDQQHTAFRHPVAAFSGSKAGANSEDAGMSDWPCDLAALHSARKFVRDAASKGGKVVLAPDRDADGLCAGRSLPSCAALALTTLVGTACMHHACSSVRMSVLSTVCINVQPKAPSPFTAETRLTHPFCSQRNKLQSQRSTQTAILPILCKSRCAPVCLVTSQLDNRSHALDNLVCT